MIKVGDKIEIIEQTGKLAVGHIGKITYIFNGLPIVDHYTFVFDHQYRVVTDEEDAATPPDVYDLLANLARRVYALEQQLGATQGNVEKLAQELATARHQTKLIEGEFANLSKLGVRPW